MWIPPGMTEAEVLEAIERAVNRLAPGFVFGFYSIEDIQQQARAEGVALMNKKTYDPSRSLQSYVYAHIRNRLINFKRDNFYRYDPPCLSCHEGKTHEDGKYCGKYLKWRERNITKQNLARPVCIDEIEQQSSPSESETNVEINEILKLIDHELPVGLRSTYLKMRAGEPVPANRRAEVELAITEIVGDTLYGG